MLDAQREPVRAVRTGGAQSAAAGASPEHHCVSRHCACRQPHPRRSSPACHYEWTASSRPVGMPCSASSVYRSTSAGSGFCPPGSSAGVKEEQTGALNLAGRRTMASVVHTERVKSEGARSALPTRCPRPRVCVARTLMGKHLGEAPRRPCLAASPCARHPERRVDDQAAGMNPLVSPVPILWSFGDSAGALTASVQATPVD